ncbi:MAG: MFS transporter, partial [Pseudomonadota bacterium]
SLGSVRVTRWLAIFYLGATIFVGLAPSPVVLGIALLLFGASHGAMDVAMNSWATEVEKSLGRSVMASFHAMWSLGAGLGAASGFLAVALGQGVAVHFTAISVIGGALFGWFLLVSWTSPKVARDASAPAFALPRGALILVGILALSAGLGEGAVADWSAVYLLDVVQTSEAQATLGYATFSVTMVVMRLSADRVVTRFGPVAVARVSGVVAGAGILLVVGPGVFWASLLGFLLMGVGYAALVPMAFSRAAEDPHVPPGQAIASVATLGYGAMLLGPPVIGFIAEASSLRAAFFMLAAFALCVVVLAPVLSRNQAE